MTFFYDLNKRLADLASKQDAKQIGESKQAETVAHSPLTQALNEGQAKRLPGLPITRKDVEKKFGGSMIKMAQAAKDAGFSNARIAQAMDDLKQGKNPNDVAEAGYSAKAARAGKDLGKPGKNFSKIAKGAAERYGSKEAGERVAGAVLNKLRHPKESVQEASIEHELRDNVLAVLKNIYNGSMAGEYMIDDVADELGDYFTAVKRSGDKTLKQAYSLMRDEGMEAEGDPQLMASVAKKAIGMLTQLEGNAFTGALAKTPKGGKFKVGGKEFKDTSSLEEGQCAKCAPAPCKCDSMEESAFQAAIGKKKYGDAGMKALQKAGREHASDKTMNNIRNRYDKYDESTGQADEGNAFTAALKATPKGGKFKVGGKEFKDTSNIEEGSMKRQMEADAERMSREKFCAKYGNEYGEFWDNCMGNLDEGFKEMDAWLASREKEKGTGRYDKRKVSTGTVYTRKPETFDDPETDPEATGGAPARRGRPKGKDKGPERVTAKSYKYKAGRPAKTQENLDSDGVMMTRPTNCSMENIDPAEQGEYNDEAGMTKDSLHTIMRHARELEKCLRQNENLPEWVQEKVGQIKGMMTSVTDYILSTHERDAEQHMEPVAEKSVSKAQRKAAGIAHAAQKGEIPKSKLRGASKEMAKMPQGELHKFAATKEKGLPKKVKEGGKPDFLDLDKDGNKTETMKKAAKEKSASKEDKVDETTVAGSVATAPATAKKSSGGMSFGKGVYESIDKQFKQALTESISIQSKMAECGDGEMAPALTIQADGEEAAKLMMLLKLAGLESQIPAACPSCGASPCGCDQMVDENSPDWPTNTEKLAAEPNLRTYSGGLNGPKSTGQTTIPVVASQERRLHSESIELERSLFKTWKNYKG